MDFGAQTHARLRSFSPVFPVLSLDSGHDDDSGHDHEHVGTAYLRALTESIAAQARAALGGWR
jgi:hypothetical protein